MTDLVLALIVGWLFRDHEQEPRRTCYWCGAEAVCTSGLADSCAEHHRIHHMSLGWCKRL